MEKGAIAWRPTPGSIPKAWQLEQRLALRGRFGVLTVHVSRGGCANKFQMTFRARMRQGREVIQTGTENLHLDV